jgi:hypothetical protein
MDPPPHPKIRNSISRYLPPKVRSGKKISMIFKEQKNLAHFIVEEDTEYSMKTFSYEHTDTYYSFFK